MISLTNKLKPCYGCRSGVSIKRNNSGHYYIYCPNCGIKTNAHTDINTLNYEWTSLYYIDEKLRLIEEEEGA